ncbi:MULTISPECIES: CGLD27 family protein [Spirulina sp. CCY15215]|uniref:CGLD27 family protein n=1 Tax=Spirulina sp. CCY15215 TaxID=2767591 RepID=UPI00194F110C|nr:CGLD27 family protein [Spirulina major]
MNNAHSSLSSCPVPIEQQPLNEYEQLKESWLFNWAVQSPFKYTRKLAWVWGLGWLVSGPIAATSFPPAKSPLNFTLAAAGGALLFVVLLLTHLYFGWSYICDRLYRETVTYEESGWYDGQIWQKPQDVLLRERLIVTYQVKPVLDRLKKTFAVLAAFIALGSVTWIVV